MSYDEQLKRYGADKIFLLALFAFSLLLAYLVVRAKKTIVLGEPVGIPEAGLSVRLPNGNGWQGDSRWEHNEDTLVLRSVFRPSTGADFADVVCMYRLASFRDSAHAWLERYAAQFDAASPEYVTQELETTGLEWVYIKQAERMSDMLAATVPLGRGRWLDIEITQMAAEDDLVRNVFEKMAKHIVIKDNESLGRGIEIVSQLKAAGLDKVTLQPEGSYYYLVKDSSQRDVGFVVEMLLKSGNTDQTEIQVAGFSYATKPNRWETAMLFKGDSNLDEYVWESQTDQDRVVQIRRGALTIRSQEKNVRTSTRVLVSQGERITVHRLGPGFDESSRADSTEFEAKIGEAAVPGAVIEAVYIQMINSDTNKVMVDIIFGDGQVKPAVITVSKASGSESQISHIVKIEYLGLNEVEETYLDNKMRVVKKVLRRNGILVLEPASQEDLVRRFPERADYILQRSQAIKQGRL
jgi:hypothetical protein